MSKINNENFWHNRLAYAKSLAKNDEMIHFSVFKVSKEYWDKIQKSHEKVILENIDIDGDKILDIGCAFGRDYIKNMKNYVGIDFSKDFINEAKRRFPDKEFVVTKMEDFETKEKFDWGILSSIKRMIIRENGLEDWNKKEEHLKKICKRILVLEYTEAAEDENYVATEIIEGYHDI